MRENSFLVCSVCDEIVSSYAQCEIKSFPRMLSMRMLKFSKIAQKYPIKMQISTIKNQNFEKPSRNPSNRTKVKILKKNFFWIYLKKYLVPRMLSHRGNVRTSKFWRKSRRKEAKFFSKILYTKGI
jgi:hypothetical protein